MPSTTHHTRYFVIEVGDDVVIIRRTAERFELDGLYGACGPLFLILRRLKHLGLVIDVRGVVGRAEPGFEEAFVPVRKELNRGHPRIAVIVETAVGRLQLTRQIREDRNDGVLEQRVFLDERAAVAFASGRESES